MTRCRVCASPLVSQVDDRLRSGASIRAVARETGIPRSTVQRHAGHLAGVDEEPTSPPPGLLAPDVGARTVASFAAALDALERAEASGRVPLIVSAVRGARAAARDLVDLTLGDVTDADRQVLEDLYVRTVNLVGRAQGRDALELAALGALRAILSDVRAAAGEAEHEAALLVRWNDGTPTGPEVLVPASAARGWPKDGVIELHFAERRNIDIDRRLLVEPGSTNGHHEEGERA